MKKGLAFFLTGALIAGTFSFAVPCTAMTAAGVQVNASNFRAVADFDAHPAGYAVGAKPGSLSDSVGLTKNKKFVQATNVGIDYNLSIVSGGASGKALELDVTNGATEEGSWSPIAFHMDNVKGDSKVENVEGAQGLQFWMDSTAFKDKSGNYESKMFVLTIQETDVMPNGALGTGACAWKTKPAEQKGYYLMEKGNSWEKVATCRDADNIPGMKVGDYVPLPKNYKGWIRIPVETFCHVSWDGNVDSNNKFDGKQIQYVAINGKNYLKDAGSKIIFDEIGFYGSFKTASSSPAVTSAKASSSSKNNGASVGGTTSSSGSASSAASSSEASSALTSSEAAVSSEESAAVSDQSSAVQTDTPASSSVPVFLIVIIIVLVLAAAGVGAFLIIRKVRKQ